MGSDGTKHCFLGEFEHALDPQRRLAIPSDWRLKGGDGRYVLLPARGGALQLMAFEEFDGLILSKARRLSLASERDMRDLAELGSRAQICECDKQGRIQISPKLVAYAGLKDKVALVGSLTYIQLLTPEARARTLGADGDGRFFDVFERMDKTPDSLSDALRGALGDAGRKD
jgi:MraZ protein